MTLNSASVKRLSFSSDWKNTAPKLNGQPIKLNQYETSRSLALFPDAEGQAATFVLGTEWLLRAFDRDGQETWQQLVPGVVWAVNVSQDGRWVVAAYGDGTIRWYRASDGVEQLAFYPHPDKKRWVLWTPNGYCVFRATWTPIPGEAGHRFQSKLDSDST